MPSVRSYSEVPENKTLQTTDLYKSFQTKLLDKEISNRESDAKSPCLRRNSTELDLRNICSPLTYAACLRFFRQRITKETTERHRKKLDSLGVNNDLYPSDLTVLY